MHPRGFGSDNHASVHPQILQALVEANRDHAPSYGTDELTKATEQLFRRHFGPSTQVFLVFNGTAANVLALRALMRPWESVFCADLSHLENDECAAPEFMTGGKLRLVPTRQGKIHLEELEALWVRSGDQHYSPPRVLSLTQPTEIGTLYQPEHLRALCDWAHAKGLHVHLDGARLPLAARALGLSLQQVSFDLGVDVISYGGTKNGLMGAEAVLFRDASLAQDFSYIRKQSGQLPSKTRFLAAQFQASLQQDLWKEIADRSLQGAQKLLHLVKGTPGLEIQYPVEANSLFVKAPPAAIKKLKSRFFFYVWNEKTWESRWMCSWDLTDEDIEAFAKAVREELK